MVRLRLSDLAKTWIIDVDGVMFQHNKYIDGKGESNDTLLPGVRSFFKKIGKNDHVILLTSRKKTYAKYTERLIRKYGLRCNVLLVDLPFGERILINDTKPMGLKTAYAINLKRDEGLGSVKIFKEKSASVKR